MSVYLAAVFACDVTKAQLSQLGVISQTNFPHVWHC